MRRRQFLSRLLASAAPLAIASGCRGKQIAHVLRGDQADMVGSHDAGAETWKPLVEEATCKLLASQHVEIQQVAHEGGLPPVDVRKRICFVGVENKSQEELGDYREQLYEQIDTIINESKTFSVVNRRFVDAGLQQCGLKPNDLFVPNSRRNFVATMEQMEQPFDYLLFAKITSGSTESNGDYQRDYQLTLELVNVTSGDYSKESAMLRKGYHKSKLSKLRTYGT
jgi:hypothetical protein